MADKKITQLVDGGAPQATDEFVIARAGDNFKLDFASIDSNLLDQAVILAPATPSRNVIQPVAGDTFALFIKAHAAQTAELMWWERADGTFIGSIDKEGHVYFQPQRQTGNGISYAISGNADHGGAGHITKLMAFDGWAYSHGPGIVDDLIGYRATASVDFAGSARVIDFYASDHFLNFAVPNVYGLLVENRGDVLATTSYGVYIAAQSGSTTNYGIYVAGGKSVFVDGLVIALIAAPADAAYANGQGGWWWDQANSLPKWKGKTSGGVVVNFTPAAAGSGAPTTATYITQTADAGLSAEQALSALATGLVKNTTATGVLSIAAQGTDYYAPGGTDVAVADGGTGASTAGGARTALGAAPLDATYITQTTNSELSGEQALSALATGIVKNTTTTGVLSIAAAGTDYYAPGGTDVALADGGTGASTAPTARQNLLAGSGQTGYQIGQYYVGECIAAGGLGGVGNNTVGLCFFVPFIVDFTTTFDRIACYITANGTAGALVRMGIYNDSTGKPGTVLLDAGTVATDAGAAAIKAITISQQLTPGVYWIAVVSQVAAAQVRRNIPLGYMQPMSSDFNGSAVTTSGITGAFANSPSLAQSVANPTTVALRVASIP